MPPPSSSVAGGAAPTLAGLSVGNSASGVSSPVGVSGVGDAVGATVSWSVSRTLARRWPAPTWIVRVVLMSSFWAPIWIWPGAIGFSAEPVNL